jgi:hypothetical protein
MMNLSGDSNNLKGDAESLIKSTSVVIGTNDYIYTGHIIHFNKERLLDVLNQGSIGDPPDLPPDYLQLHDMRVCSMHGQRETISPNSLIAKNGILYLGEEKSNEIEIPCLHWDWLKKFIKKEPVCVEIHVPSIFIMGMVHIEPWQRIIGSLNDSRRFIPVTNALVSSRFNDSLTEFKFVAVNKSQISCIAKVEQQS